ncbi:OmpW/AlkL family protein [Trinickia acidisoli]|uniref:OmpW/AlkL family protein n=1 Tax=Trinickia acidisoli TaxID=2767482 RepID=UPI001A8F7791|nr:OmpW family protein [Trinickia acidisoli]
MLLVLVGMGFCRAALAQNAGDTIVSVGGAWIDFAYSSSSNFQSASAIGDVVSPGTNAQIHNAVTGEFQFTHFLSGHAAVELIMGWPPTLNMYAQGSVAPLGAGGPQLPLGNFQPLASASAWAPMVLFKYYFSGAQARLRPFIGFGANYTWYSNIGLNSAFEQVAQQFAGAGGSVQSSVSPSWNPVAEAGFSYRLADRWFATATLLYMPTRTNVTITSVEVNGVATLTSKTRLVANPIIAYLGVGYRF